MRYVSIKEDERFVICPVCGRVVDLDDITTTACAHFAAEDYITPRGPFMCGYDVRFEEG
jgi:hypothetical protein